MCEQMVKFLSKITPSRLSRISFDTEKLNRKHREVFEKDIYLIDKWVPDRYYCSRPEQTWEW